MSKKKIKDNFLFHLEFFYRNFGSQWCIDDFPPEIKKHKDIIIPYLKELENIDIIELKDRESFTIKQLPSTIIDLND